MMTFNEKILCSVLCFCLASFALTCREGFDKSSSSKCLKLVYNSSGFDTVVEANDICIGLGAYMARMVTTGDNSFMTGMLQDVKDKHNLRYVYAYLGGSDIANEGEFVWTNGIPIDLSSSMWKEGEPNDFEGNGGEDCIMLNHYGKLNDVPCCSRRAKPTTSVICEYDPDAKQIVNDDVFYEKCRANTSTVRIQTKSEYMPASDTSAATTLAGFSPSDSTITLKESITHTDVVKYSSVSHLQDSRSGEYNTFEQKGIEMTEYPSTPMAISTSMVEESLYLTPGFDESDTGFASASHVMNTYRSESVAFSNESITPTSALGYLSVFALQETPSSELSSSGQKRSVLLEITEYLSTPLDISSSVIEESLYPASGLESSDTGFLSTGHIIGKLYSSESVEFPSENGQHIGTMDNVGSEFYRSANVVDRTSLLDLGTSSLGFISTTPRPHSSSGFISVSSTQRSKVTVMNQLSSVDVSYRAVPLIPKSRRQCSNKKQYKTDIKINMLKIARNETQRFKRKFSCAQDNRISSLIIVVVSCLLLLVSYLFIVVTDLLKIRSIRGARQINRRENKTKN